MRRVNTREFRAGFGTFDEPVEVMNRTKTIGFFYPGETVPAPQQTWSPAGDGWDELRAISLPKITRTGRTDDPSLQDDVVELNKTAQKKRDEILRRMSKTK